MIDVEIGFGGRTVSPVQIAFAHSLVPSRLETRILGLEALHAAPLLANRALPAARTHVWLMIPT